MIQRIERAIQALAALQRPSGEWPTEWSSTTAMTQPQEYEASPYVTGFVIHGLVLVQGAGKPLLERAQSFLLSIQSDESQWNYEGPAGNRIPDDLDVTAVASAALLLCGQRPTTATYRLLWENEMQPGGPYYTWIGVNRGNSGFAREVDLLVNANIAWLAGLAGMHLAALGDYLSRSVLDSAYDGNNGRYLLSPHLATYCLGRAAADGGMTGLAELLPQLHQFVLAKLPPTDNPFELACNCVTLLNAGASDSEILSYLEPLMALQQADGGWRSCAAWISFDQGYDGSPALTTALALEALWKWQQRQQTS